MAERKTTFSRRTKIAIVCAAVVLFAEIFFYTWCHVQFRNTQYEFTDFRRELSSLNFIQDNLEIELARLRSPERIMAIAKEKIGLVMPNAEQFVNLP